MSVPLLISCLKSCFLLHTSVPAPPWVLGFVLSLDAFAWYVVPHTALLPSSPFHTDFAVLPEKDKLYIMSVQHVHMYIAVFLYKQLFSVLPFAFLIISRPLGFLLFPWGHIPAPFHTILLQILLPCFLAFMFFSNDLIKSSLASLYYLHNWRKDFFKKDFIGDAFLFPKA